MLILLFKGDQDLKIVA